MLSEALSKLEALSKDSVLNTTKGGVDTIIHQQQCWEYMGCGQESARTCMSYIRYKGRQCWLAAGSFSQIISRCMAARRCTPLKSIGHCTKCEFYIGVEKGYL